METTEIMRIEEFLRRGDPYTLVLLAVDNGCLVAENTDYREAEKALKFFKGLIKKQFSSGMLITSFEEDMFLAFAPFILNQNYMMTIFDSVQQQYYDYIHAEYQGKEVSVSVGCVMGVKQSTLEELLRKAEKLTAAIKKQGRYGYKILEN